MGLPPRRRHLLPYAPKLGGITSFSCILKSTPTILSLCARVSSKQAAFVWIPEHRPAFLFPDGIITILTVVRDCPYLDEESIQTTIDDSIVRELCGVSRHGDGSVILHFAFPFTSPAAPAVGEASDCESSGHTLAHQVDPLIPEPDRDNGSVASTPDDASLFGPSTPRSVHSAKDGGTYPKH